MAERFLGQLAKIVKVVLLFSVVSVQGQTAGGYRFETGVDSTLWMDMAGAQQFGDEEQLVDLGFDFFFCGTFYQRLSVDWRGSLYFNRTHGTYDAYTLPPVMVPYGMRLYANPVYWKVSGPLGNRVFAVEIRVSVNGLARPIQVQLFERDGSILYLYGAKGSSYHYSYFWIGMKGEAGTVVSVNQHNEIMSEEVYWSPGFSDWPGENRYYRFVPDLDCYCGFPRGVTMPNITSTEASVCWNGSYNDSGYEFAYRRTDTIMDWMTVFTSDTSITVSDLSPSAEYEFSVRAICSEGCTSMWMNGTFQTECMEDAGNQIRFADLYANNVICYKGSYNNPMETIEVVDYGPSNISSQHTVHTDKNELDPYTRSLLHTVPEGNCHSVRLGNWRGGAEAESIVYRLDVDSNQYDLLILRYAVVEENPNHPSEEQPKFILSIRDPQGELIDSCYYANFVAGVGDSVWQAGIEGVVWRDWTAVGIDLTPLHGRTVYVMLNNFDCSQGGHFGYAYFTLESGFKRLQSAYCGHTDTNIFYAPKGFSYRWYRAGNPDSTLSREDSLVVVGTGEYKCQASFTTGDSSCGITLTTHAGTRFPMAAFSVVPKDSCGYSFTFENHSVVARDEARTQLINEDCEQYLWRFGDGTTSSAISPTHSFETGTYNVELVAMLANGQCRDSVSQTITVYHLHDTVADTFCVGGFYRFYNVTYIRPGFYTVTDGCWRHSIQLAQQQYFYQELSDTLCMGEAYIFDDHRYDTTGEYNIHLTSVEGCDSSYHLSLAIRPLPSSSYEIAHTCHGMPYYYLKGNYHLADTMYTEPGSVTFVGTDSLLYRWYALTPNAPLPVMADDGTIRILTTRQVTYCVQCQYMDSPACSVFDTLVLSPLEEIAADLDVSPEWLGYEKHDLTVLDRSRNASGREWWVDGVKQDEDGSILYYSVAPEADSVVVGVVAYNSTCTDTAERVVPVLRHLLMFPNVFTPSLATNSRFGPVGSNITEYELWIYDRRGALVFHSTDMADTWDGTCNGIPCKQEAYAYICRYTTPTKDRLSTTGTVTLLR